MFHALREEILTDSIAATSRILRAVRRFFVSAKIDEIIRVTREERKRRSQHWLLKNPRIRWGLTRLNTVGTSLLSSRAACFLNIVWIKRC